MSFSDVYVTFSGTPLASPSRGGVPGVPAWYTSTRWYASIMSNTELLLPPPSYILFRLFARVEAGIL